MYDGFWKDQLRTNSFNISPLPFSELFFIDETVYNFVFILGESLEWLQLVLITLRFLVGEHDVLGWSQASKGVKCPDFIMLTFQPRVRTELWIQTKPFNWPTLIDLRDIRVQRDKFVSIALVTSDNVSSNIRKRMFLHEKHKRHLSKRSLLVRYEVLTAVSMKSAVCSVLAPCRLV